MVEDKIDFMANLPDLRNYMSDTMFIILIVGISLIDIFANSLSVVPVIGTFASVVSESALEGMQILLVLIFGGRRAMP